MTQEKKTEVLHSIRGPVFSMLGGLLAAGLLWLFGSGSRMERINGRITAVEAMANETKTEYRGHCGKQDEHDLKLAETLGSMKKSLENIEKKLNY